MSSPYYGILIRNTGAASVLLMTRRKAQELGLPILAKHVMTSVAGKLLVYYGQMFFTFLLFKGVPPRIMGIGNY
jgi:hypothetical protein